MEMIINEIWDERHWQSALKTDKPGETYAKIKSDQRALDNEVPVDDLSPEQQAWLRSS